MHEWALAEGVIQTASGVAKEQGLEKITEIVARAQWSRTRCEQPT